MKRSTAGAGLAILGAALVCAQEFEVASVKPSDPNQSTMMRGDAGQVRFLGAELRLLVQMAYGVAEAQIIGATGWMNSARYDIVAKWPDTDSDWALPANFSELTGEQRQSFMQRRRLAMWQALLADRFQLKLHRETREMPVYILTVAKGGPKLKDNGGKVSDPNVPLGAMRGGAGILKGSQTTISHLLLALSQIMGRNILDQTGLAGKYDFELKWTPDQNTARGPLGGALPPPGAPRPGPLPLGVQAPPPPDPNGPSIFTALEEQLGLKMDSSKGPVEVVVIDHAEKPSEN